MLSRCAVGCFHQAHSLKTTNLGLRGRKPGWPTDQTRSQTFQRSSVLLRGTENCWDVTDVMGMSLQMKECPLESHTQKKAKTNPGWNTAQLEVQTEEQLAVYEGLMRWTFESFSSVTPTITKEEKEKKHRCLAVSKHCLLDFMVKPMSEWTHCSLSLNYTVLLPLWFLTWVVLALSSLALEKSVCWMTLQKCRTKPKTGRVLKILTPSRFTPLLFHLAFNINYFPTLRAYSWISPVVPFCFFFKWWQLLKMWIISS